MWGIKEEQQSHAWVHMKESAERMNEMALKRGCWQGDGKSEVWEDFRHRRENR